MSFQYRLVTRQPQTDALLSPHPLLNRLYQARGVRSPDELDYRLAKMLNPAQLENLASAMELLLEAYHAQSRIVIAGDYDADGATSTALVIKALKMFGFQHVSYLIPDRFSEGYGLTLPVAERILRQGADLVLTVDNGISAFDGIAHLKQAGVKVLVTDHHLPAETLPNADAIINPNLAHCAFPSKAMAGVGVAFYVMVGLRAKLREQGIFSAEKQPNLSVLLDLVALGTVADVVPLDHNNRLLIKQGLDWIQQGKACVGIKALAEIANIPLEKIKASDIGYRLAPRLNAAGRLDRMEIGVELLLCENMALARQLAQELDELNANRKEIEEGMKAEALAICARLQQERGETMAQQQGILLYQADWHQGVIGILAARIKEQFHRPVIAFCQDEGELIKGSARSIPGVHMRDILAQINTEMPDLIQKFGGHAMAAGLTIKQQDFTRFSEIFHRILAQEVNPADLNGTLETDGELGATDFNLDTAELLAQSGPWGQKFPEPLFEGTFNLLQQRLLKEKYLKMLLEAPNGELLDAICFNVDLRQFPDQSIKRVKLAYQLDVNEFQGKRRLQLLVESVQPCR